MSCRQQHRHNAHANDCLSQPDQFRIAELIGKKAVQKTTKGQAQHKQAGQTGGGFLIQSIVKHEVGAAPEDAGLLQRAVAEEGQHDLFGTGDGKNLLHRKGFCLFAVFTGFVLPLFPQWEAQENSGGQKDLNDRILRTVGEPERRFREDALRVLRAVRFGAQLGFSIESQTAQAMEREADRIGCVSAERIVAELEKTLLSDRPEQVGEFFRLGAMERFGCRVRESDWKELAAVPAEAEARWPVLCWLTGLDITAVPVSRVVRRAVLKPNAGKEKLLALSGGELAGLGLRGAEIGRAQKILLERVLSRPEENQKERLLMFLRKKGILK